MMYERASVRYSATPTCSVSQLKKGFLVYEFSLLDIWYLELRALYGNRDDVVVEKINTSRTNIPTRSLHEALSEVLKHAAPTKKNFRVDIVSRVGSQEVCVFSLKTLTTSPSMSPVKIVAFSDLKSVLSNADSGAYSEAVLAALGRRGGFLKLGGRTYVRPPSIGEVDILSGTEKSIAICTPCYRRFDVLEIYLKYTLKYLMPQLVLSGYNPYLVISGGEEEREFVAPFCALGNVVFLQHPNNLGEKKNLLLDFARCVGFDYLTFIDSDDLIHPETMSALIETSDLNSYWSAIEAFCFLDVDSQRWGIFEGYAESHSLYGWGMGSGRVFTKKLLSEIANEPFVRANKGMDANIRTHLGSFDIPKEKRLVLKETPIKLPIGLKCDENIWGYDRYKLSEVDSTHPQLCWLPFDILRLIKSMGT